MRGRAKHRIAYNGRFYEAGDILAISPGDVIELSQYCDLMEGEDPVSADPDAAAAEPEKRRGRPRKSGEN